MRRFRAAVAAAIRWPFTMAWRALALLGRGVRWFIGLFSLRDAFVFGGLAAACYGIVQVHAPSAWIAGGTAVLLIGLRR